MSDAPLRVLGYGRQSKERPGEDPNSSLSLNGQADLFRAECAKRGWIALDFIRDHDLKGDDPTRPGIADLKERCTAGGVDAVWVVMLNRFSNDYIWQGMTWRELKRRGVQHLISYTEGNVDDEFLLGIHGLVSGKRITELKVHLRNAMARRAKEGNFPHGLAPLGYVRPHRITVTRANGTTYEKQTGTPEIDPEGAAIVREVFDRYIAGESFRSLGEWLEHHVPTARGGHWWMTTVRNLIVNPIYVGDIKHKTTDNIVAHNPAWAIIDRETWTKAQARLGRHYVIRGDREHWLEGLTHHSCGQRMYYSTRSVDDPHGDYVCRSRKRVSTLRCQHDRPRLAANTLERVVRTALANDLSRLRPPKDAIALANERAGGPAALRARADLDKRLADARARWERNHERFSIGKLPSATMDAEDARLEQAERDYADGLTALPVAPDPARIVALADELASVAAAVQDMTHDELRGLLAALGHVIVGEHGVRIWYGEADPAGVLLCPTEVPVPKWAHQRGIG